MHKWQSGIDLNEMGCLNVLFLVLFLVISFSAFWVPKKVFNNEDFFRFILIKQPFGDSVDGRNGDEQ